MYLLRGRWPDCYREGVVQGLFVNEDGQAHAYAAASADCAAELLQHHSAPGTVLTGLANVLDSASWSLHFQRDHKRHHRGHERRAEKDPDEAKPAWNTIIVGLETRVPDGIR